MSHETIRQILDVNLQGIPNLPEIRWPGIPYANPEDSYITPIYVPTSTRPAVLGNTSNQNVYRGLYRIKLFVLEGDKTNTNLLGVTEISETAQRILDVFKPKQALSFNNDFLRVLYSDRGQVISDSPFNKIVIDVAWYYYDQ